ncbi:MAG TPA: branched-chain amino acid ABC transporter permease, partial [Candidatus Polarisedimenticolia bacterium]|nr:branched-chain amino acid ABC transporter permease [Candidatus Polarisedimenticolia bacterium]
MNGSLTDGPLPKKILSPHLIVIWLFLLSLPLWLLAIGGYYSIVTQVLILGLAAMALNYLLGFTGVLSFGHAAYFGLGAYGCGLTIKFIAASTPLGILVGVMVGTIAGALIGALIVRLRGVY